PVRAHGHDPVAITGVFDEIESAGPDRTRSPEQAHRAPLIPVSRSDTLGSRLLHLYVLTTPTDHVQESRTLRARHRSAQPRSSQRQTRPIGPSVLRVQG